MVALPYAEIGSRTEHITRQGDIYGGVRVNWRLALALAANVVVWVAVIHFVQGLLS